MALPNEDLVLFHPGQVSLGAGKLRDATMADFEYTNDAKLEHSLMRSPNGVVIGVKECKGSFEVVVGEKGPERDYLGLCQSGQITKMQYEIPTLNCEIALVIGSVKVALKTGESIKFTIGFVGKLSEGVPTG